MNLTDIIQEFKQSKREIKYDGSLSFSQPFQSDLFSGYLKSLLLFENQIKPIIPNPKVQSAEIGISRMTLSLEASIELFARICKDNNWQYSISWTPIDCGDRIEQALTVHPSIGPLIIRMIEYIDKE